MATDHNFKVKKGLDVLGGDVNLGDGFAYKIDGTTVIDSSKNIILGTTGKLVLGSNATTHPHFKYSSPNESRHHTAHGYISFGPTNSTGAHIYTDRDRFYFNKKISLIDNKLISYNDDLQLRREDADANRIVVGDGVTTIHTPRTVITGTGTNSTPSTDHLQLSGYGIIGNRATVYLTNSNANGIIQIGVGGAHNANSKVVISSANTRFNTPITMSGVEVIDSSRNIAAGTISSGAITASSHINLTAGQLKLRNDVALDHDGSSLYVKAPSAIYLYPGNTNHGNISSSGTLTLKAYQVNGTTVIDSSRNLTNIGTVSSGAITSSGVFRSTAASYSANQDVAYMIAGTSSWTGATTNWNTFGIQHRIKTNSGGTPRVTIDSPNGEQFSVDNNGNVIVAGSLYVPQFIYHDGDTNTYIQFTGDRVRIAAGGTVKFDSSNTYQTTAAPSAVSITSSTIISETVEIVFGQSSTSGISRYEIWSDGGGSDFSLIGKINAQDAASSMSFVDTTFVDTGTINYRVYAVRYGIYSTAATTSVSFSQPSLDVTNFSAIADLNNFYLQYEKPDTRFLDHIEIYVDVDASSSNLARSGASLIYSGDNSSYMYTISASDRNNFHQFWVECVGV